MSLFKGQLEEKQRECGREKRVSETLSAPEGSSAVSYILRDG